MSEITRRQAIQFALSAGAALAMNRAVQAATESATFGQKKLRIGFIGVGDRGTGLLRVMLQYPDVEIPAICDIKPPNLKRAQDAVEKAHQNRPEGYDKDAHDYRRLLERDDVDAVLIATPQELHAEMSIDAFKAKKFVGSEVPACTTIDECWKMVNAQRELRGGYMMLENYLYNEAVMTVQNMVDKGLFGDLTYGFGGYIHEIRHMRFEKDGSLTWRGENVLHNRGVVYPTHAIGPVCRWMKVDGSNDKLETLVAMDSKAAGTKAYAAGKFGADSPQAQINFENGDTNQALIRTKLGRLIEIRYDTASPRPPGMGQYSLQGTKASYDSAFGLRKIYIEGKSKPETWDDLDAYEKQYQHPYWAKEGEKAKTTSHGGGDWFVIGDFLRAIRTGQSPVGIYDAVTWTSIRPLSEESIRGGNKPVAVPDFRKS